MREIRRESPRAHGNSRSVRVFGACVRTLVLPVLLAAVAVTSVEAKVTLVAHRGCRLDYPENTLVCFQHAVNSGVDWIETDSWLSSDSVPMLHHDVDLCRTTNIDTWPGYDCSDPANNPLGRLPWVRDFTAAELKTLDVGSWLDPSFAGTQMPTLEEALLLIEGSGVPLIVEIKDLNQAPIVKQILDTNNIGLENIIIWNRNHSWDQFKAEIPNARRVRGLFDPLTLTEQDLIDLAANGEYGLAVQSPNFTQSFIDTVHANGLVLYSLPGPTGAMNFYQQIDMGVVVQHSEDWAGHMSLLNGLLCVDGIDNDGDGNIDFDGYDVELDGTLEFQPDAECLSRLDQHEFPQCSDGFENDGDGLADFPADGGCDDALDLDESGPFAGRIPDGATLPGTPLRLAKLAGSDLELTFGASCNTSDTDYNVYEGVLGNYYSHIGVSCTTLLATSWTLAPSAGDRYYLVVPRQSTLEGSYGADSNGVQRPQVSACALQAFGGCSRLP